MNFKKITKQNYLLIQLIALLVWSCDNPEGGRVTPDIPNETIEAYPGEEGEIVTIMYHGKEIEVEKIGDEYIMEGDIIVTPDDLISTNGRTESAGNGVASWRWPGGIVYYTIDPSLPNQGRVTNAIAHWESRTYFEFRQRTSQPDYINFRPGSGCSSSIGRRGGKQNINLASGCSTGSTIHEIGHAIGLYHEQSRKDRDDHIIINFGNIKAGKSHNFNKYGSEGFDATATFDFGSIMMYGPRAFSKNGQPTITKKNGGLYSANRSGLSNMDRAGVMRMYRRGNNMNGPYKYDFGTETSPVFSGNMPVFENTDGPIGWSSTAGLQSRDRGSASGTNDINRDFIFSSSTRTFRQPISNGTWKVRVTFGDRLYPHDNMVIRSGGIQRTVTTNANEYKTVEFSVNVTNENIAIEFSDNGGSDPNWAVTRVWILK